MLEKNQLMITDENGEQIVVNVWDIISRRKSLFKKIEYIIYSPVNEPDSVYASILNEGKNSYSFDTITDPDDLAFVNQEIEKFLNEPD